MRIETKGNQREKKQRVENDLPSADARLTLRVTDPNEPIDSNENQNPRRGHDGEIHRQRAQTTQMHTGCRFDLQRLNEEIVDEHQLVQRVRGGQTEEQQSGGRLTKVLRREGDETARVTDEAQWRGKDVVVEVDRSCGGIGHGVVCQMTENLLSIYTEEKKLGPIFTEFIVPGGFRRQQVDIFPIHRSQINPMLIFKSSFHSPSHRLIKRRIVSSQTPRAALIRTLQRDFHLFNSH